MEELWKMCPSLGWLVRVSARRFPKNTAVIFQGEETSYAELDRLSDSVAWVLKDHGVGPGDSVALSLPNSPAFVAGYFGILKTGASVVPINLLLSAEEVAYIVSDAGVKAGIYWCGAGVDLCNLQEKGCRFSCLIAGNAGGRPGCLSLKEVLKRDCPAVEIPGLNQTEDVAAIIYTSGTTGQPKGAMLTHRNLLFNVNSVVSSLPLSEKDRFIAVLPMFHAFGATACMLVPLALGATIVALTRFVPEEVVKIIEVTRATVFMGVPSMYALLAQIPQRQLDFSSLRFCISGGAPLPAEVLERFEKRYGVLIYEGDGPTECSPVTAVNPVGGRRKISSIGLPVAGVEMKIVDESGRELPDGCVGEIVVRGENVMKGYLHREVETREAFFGDWFRTGDLGYRDKDGYFFIVDRRKDMIIVNGMNVYPRMVEEVLYRHPAVAEAAVVGQAHPLHGEVPKAVLVLKPGMSASREEIIVS